MPGELSPDANLERTTLVTLNSTAKIPAADGSASPSPTNNRIKAS